MLSLKNHFLFHIIITFALFISHQQNNPSFTENFSFAPYQSYVITCITSCCIGIIIGTLIQKYYFNNTTIGPKQNPKDETLPIKLLEGLHTKMNNAQPDIAFVKKEQKKLIDIITQHTNSMNDFINLQNKNTRIRSAELTAKIKVLRQKEKDLREFSPLYKKNSFLLASALYWHQKYTEKTKECELGAQQLTLLS